MYCSCELVEWEITNKLVCDDELQYKRLANFGTSQKDNGSTLLASGGDWQLRGVIKREREVIIT